MCKKLSQADLHQADSLGIAVGNARNQTQATALALKNAALLAGSAALTTSTPKIALLWANHEAALQAHDAALQAEAAWWRSKGFNI